MGSSRVGSGGGLVVFDPGCCVRVRALEGGAYSFIAGVDVLRGDQVGDAGHAELFLDPFTGRDDDEVCRLEEPETRLAYHVIPGHGLEDVATLHNYLASIFTCFRPTEPQAIPVSAQVSDVQTSRRPSLCQSWRLAAHPQDLLGCCLQVVMVLGWAS